MNIRVVKVVLLCGWVAVLACGCARLTVRTAGAPDRDLPPGMTWNASDTWKNVDNNETEKW